ncbi:MAG: glycosyltransferase family 4 protein [Bacteroidota bacterium]|jgi:UDP-GlcNAc:undecaprenyl-phosphate GlcNAc-1-phosphate transferase
MNIFSNNIPLLVTFFFAGMFVFSVLINTILLRFSKTLGIRNNPDQQIRWSSTVKPAVGGISFFIVFLLSFLALGLVIKNFSDYLNSPKLIGLLVAVTIAFIMGLADDAFDTNPLIKLSAQIGCALTIMLTGTKICCFESEFMNYLITFLWVVGLMNSINMLDNMDGITTLVSIMILLFFVSQRLIIKDQLIPQSFICLAMLGALSGFIIFNWHPSKMFMGDTGSQVLGILLAFMGIDFCWNTPVESNNTMITYLPLKNFLIATTIFVLPIADTFTVFTNRLLKGNSPFVGGKDHTTHHLFFRGITEKRIAVIFTFIGALGVYFGYELTGINSKNNSDYYVFLLFPFIIISVLYLNTKIKNGKNKT